MRGPAGKLFVAMLLTLCVVAYVIEMSGRWDQSIEDANDEAGLVAIVLCIGVALSAAGALIQHMCASRPTVRVMFAAFTASLGRDHQPALLLVSTSSPPRRLRI